MALATAVGAGVAVLAHVDHAGHFHALAFALALAAVAAVFGFPARLKQKLFSGPSVRL